MSRNTQSQRKNMPAPNESFVGRSADLMNGVVEPPISGAVLPPKDGSPLNLQGRDMTVSRGEFISRRMRERIQRYHVRNMQTGVPQDIDSEEFLNGLRGLQFQRKPLNLSTTRENELRAIMKEMLQDYPEGFSSAGFMAELRERAESSFYLSSLRSRKQPGRKLVDAAVDALKDIKIEIDALKASDPSSAKASQLDQDYQKIVRSYQALLSPGHGTLMIAESVPQVLRQLEEKIQSEASPSQGFELSIVQKSRARLERLLGELDPQMGKGMDEEVRIAIAEVEKVLILLQPGQEGTPKGALLQQVLAVHGAMKQSLRRDAMSHYAQKDYADRLNALYEEVKGHAGEGTVLYNRMVGHQGALQHERKFLDEQTAEYDETRLADELEYCNLVRDYYNSCGRFELTNFTPERGPNIDTALRAWSNASAILKLVDPDNHFIQPHDPDGPAVALADVVQKFGDTFSQFSRAEFEDAGFSVREMPHSFEYALDRWQGRPPLGQVTVDNIEAYYTTIQRIEIIGDHVHSEFSRIYTEAETGGWEQSRLQTELKKVYDSGWEEIKSIREEVADRVKATAVRARTQGIDELDPLTERQQEAFALLLEQAQRREQPELDTYRSQANRLWVPGFVQQPVSDLISGGERDSSLSGLSDAQLTQKAAQFGDDLAIAQRVYDRLVDQVVNQEPGQNAAGYQELLTILERLQPDPNVDLLGTMSKQNVGGQQIYMRNEKFVSFVQGDWIKMATDMSKLLWNEMAADPQRLDGLFYGYDAMNSEYPQRELLRNRVTRFREKFRRYYDMVQQQP